MVREGLGIYSDNCKVTPSTSGYEDGDVVCCDFVCFLIYFSVKMSVILYLSLWF
jgi:hypothetical protein